MTRQSVDLTDWLARHKAKGRTDAHREARRAARRRARARDQFEADRNQITPEDCTPARPQGHLPPKGWGLGRIAWSALRPEDQAQVRRILRQHRQRQEKRLEQETDTRLTDATLAAAGPGAETGSGTRTRRISTPPSISTV